MSKEKPDKVIGQAIVNTAVVSIGLSLNMPQWQDTIINNVLWEHSILLIILSEKLQSKFLLGKICNTAYIAGSVNFVAEVASAISRGLCEAAIFCDETGVDMFNVRRLPKNDMYKKITANISRIVAYNYDGISARDRKFLRRFNGIMELIFTSVPISESLLPLPSAYMSGAILEDIRKVTHTGDSLEHLESKSEDENVDDVNVTNPTSCKENQESQNSDRKMPRNAVLYCRILGSASCITHMIAAATKCDDTMTGATPEIVEKIHRIKLPEIKAPGDNDLEGNGCHVVIDLATGILDYILQHKFTAMQDLVYEIIALQDDVKKSCAAPFRRSFGIFCRECIELIDEPLADHTQITNPILNETAQDTGAEEGDDENTAAVPTDSYM